MNDLLKPDDTRDALRALGAVLLGLAVLVISVRKDDPSGFVENSGWGDGALFFLYLIPAVVLYVGSMLSFQETDELRPWQSIASVFGLLFVALTLSQFVDMIGGDASASLNVAWISVATAACAFFAAVYAGVRFHFLAGGLALLVAWLALWNKLLEDGVFDDLGTLRGLLGIFSILLLAGGLYLWRNEDDGLWKGSELLTAAGIAAVLATAVISITSSFVSQIAALFSPEAADVGAGPTLFWDVVTLLVVLGLILLGTLIGTRGPVYVGALGLVLFAMIVGQDLDSALNSRDNDLVGWPLLLLILGILAIVLSFVREASLGDQPRRFAESLRGR